MAADIQNISITDALTVHKPSKHIEYTLQVSTPTRTWSVNRRYNDFVALHAELRSSTGKEPPVPLPPKHWFARTMNDEEKIRQRRVQLELYIRTILTTKDARWRASYGFSDFLAVPTRVVTSTNSTATLTASTWLTEHASVSALLRNARAALLKRDALARVGDAASRAAGGEARRLLRDAGPRVDALESGLTDLANLGEGERRRRDDMVASLRAEHANLLRTAEAGVRMNRSETPPPEAAGVGARGGSAFGGPSAGSGFTSGRVFGKRAPQETAETRPLDEQGLVQLQHQQMRSQDEQATVLSGLLQRQRRMGEEINEEIHVQNEMLDQIETGVDRVNAKLGRTKRQLNRLG